MVIFTKRKQDKFYVQLTKKASMDGSMFGYYLVSNYGNIFILPHCGIKIVGGGRRRRGWDFSLGGARFSESHYLFYWCHLRGEREDWE